MDSWLDERWTKSATIIVAVDISSWNDERWQAVQKLKNWLTFKTFRNPETGAQVLFKSLPFEEQKKVREQFKARKQRPLL